jgi:hypothetical protein
MHVTQPRSNAPHHCRGSEFFDRRRASIHDKSGDSVPFGLSEQQDLWRNTRGMRSPNGRFLCPTINAESFVVGASDSHNEPLCVGVDQIVSV